MSRVYYCGCVDRVGHFTYESPKNRHYFRDSVGPWKYLDSKDLHPYGYQDPTGLAQLTYLDGWTALGINDRTVDSRPNSHSTFATEGIFTFEEMLAKAREAWPLILARIEAQASIKLSHG